MAEHFQLLRDGDLCFLTFLAILLMAVGNHFMARYPVLHEWARRIAAVAFLAFCAYDASTRKPYDEMEWILLLLRGLVVGAVTLGFASVILPIVALLKHALIDAPLRSARMTLASTRARCMQRSDEHERQRNEQLRTQAELAARANRFQQQESHSQAARRRADARAQVELTFSLLASKLDNRFTRQMLTDYISTYMGDHHSPDDVQRRGDDLITTLQTHVQQEGVAESLVDLDQLDTWFQAQRQRIQSSAAEDKLKRRLLASLHVRYAELAQRIMENLQP